MDTRWTMLNFDTNTIELDRKKYVSGAWSANIKQHRIFYNEFIVRGKNSCTFKEFREKCRQLNQLDELTDFDHRGHKFVKYGRLNLDYYDFTFLKRFMKDAENATLEDAFSILKDSYKKLEKEIERLKKNGTEGEKILEMIKSLKQFLK